MRAVVSNDNRTSRMEAMEAVRTFISWAGDNPDRAGVKETPRRVVDALEEVFSENPDQIKDQEFLRKIFGTSPKKGQFNKYLKENSEPKVSRQRAVEAMETLVRFVGYNKDDTKQVAEKFFEGFGELVVGMQVDIPKIYEKTFTQAKGANGPVALNNIPVSSLCEHHLFGFKGVANVMYLPGLNEEGEQVVVGLSKLARGVDARSRRFQIQEGLTVEVANDLMENIKPSPRGVAVVIEAAHGCMQNRGVHSTGTKMVTSHVILSEELEKSDKFADKLAVKSFEKMVEAAYKAR